MARQNTNQSEKEQTKPIVATSAKEWRRKTRDGEWFILPTSQNTVRLKRPSLQAMATRAGNVPNALSATVLKFIAQSNGARDPLETWTVEKRNKQYIENGKAFLEICQMCFVEPTLVLDREPNEDLGEIGPDDLADTDIMWIVFNFVEGDAAAVANFRAEVATSDGADRSDSEAVRETSVGDSDDS